MNQTRSVRSQALDLLRFPLACVVVTIHVFAGCDFAIQGEEFDLSGYGVFMALTAFAKAFLAAQSVPVYFFIAGYVFFLGITLTKETYFRKMKNRFRSLFIPYVLWNVLGIVMVLFPFIPALHSIFPGCDWHDLNISFRTILSCFWNYAEPGTVGLIDRPINAAQSTLPGDPATFPVDTAMWFVRDLMIVAALTPAISWLLKKFGVMLPAISGIIWFCTPNLGLGHVYQLITALFFFSFGAYFSFHQFDMVEEFRKYRTTSYYVYVLSALYLLAYTYFSGNIKRVVMFGFADSEMMFVKNITIIAGLFCADNLAVHLIEKYHIRPSKLLSSAAFFVYAAHLIVLEYVKKIVSLLFPPVSDFNAVMLYLLTDVVTCCGLLALYIVMKRYTPKLLSPLIGGRL